MNVTSLSTVQKWAKIQPSDNAEKILKERYYLKDQEGNYIENSWSDVCRRVARVVATAELVNNPELDDLTNVQKAEFLKEIEQQFYYLMLSRVFIPNSPTLFNAGSGVELELLYKPVEQMTFEDYQQVFKQRNYLHMLSACFVVPIEDSIDGIFEAVKEYALITKVGGGIGSNFSALRPKGSFVAGTSGKASGSVSFMHVYNSAVGVVEQGYKRRGALMGILNIDHPDIEEFVSAKKNNDGKSILNFFNISVGIPFDKQTLKRMIENGETIIAKHPKSTITKEINVRTLFEQIAENAWKSGEPGLAFLGEMNKYNPMYPYKIIESTNPCGEIGLPPYEACNLGSIDVAKFLVNDEFLWNDFAEVVKLAVRFLDNVIDVNVFPLEKITKAVKASRRIGLGIMGLADLLYQLKLPYNSQKAREFSANLMAFIAIYAHDESNRLGRIKGSFPDHSLSRYYTEDNFIPFAKGMSKYDENIDVIMKESKFAKRNVAVTTIAPTGTISNIADTSSGLEPNFLLAYVRYMTKYDGSLEPLVYVNKYLVKELEKHNIPVEQIQDQLLNEGTLKNINIPEEIKKVFVTAMDIAPIDHLLMQDALQRYVDNNISKTINMPHEATAQDIFDIYIKALDTAVRGLTVYRDGSLQTQVLKKKEDKKDTKKVTVSFEVLDVEPIEHFDGKPLPAEEVKAKVLKYNLQWYQGFYVDDKGNTFCPSCLAKNSILKQEGCTSCKKCGWSKCS